MGLKIVSVAFPAPVYQKRKQFSRLDGLGVNSQMCLPSQVYSLTCLPRVTTWPPGATKASSNAIHIMDSEIMTYMNSAKHKGLQKNTNTEISSLMVVVTFRDPESTCSESRMEAEREEIRVRADTQTHPKSTGKNGSLRCSRD